MFKKIINVDNIILESGDIMNQEKIGNFIQEQRKKQNLTQEQLAEKLGITKGAVSKWERGLSLMDMSLLKPLSEALNVSIIEIINGEKIKEKELKQKSEEAIEKTIKHTKININNTKKKMVILLSIFILALILIIGISYKIQKLIYYNIEKKDSEYIEDLLDGLNNEKNMDLKFNKFFKDEDYLKWQDLMIKNDFQGMEEKHMGKNQFLLIDESSDKSKRKSFYIARTSTYMEEFIDWPSNLKIKEINEFYINNDIYNDIDLIKIVRDRYYAKNNIFTSVNKMKENYAINLFQNLYIGPAKSFIILNGKYDGYIFEYKDYYEINIFKNNQKYVLIFQGEEYMSLEYIKSMLEGLEIADA